MAKKSSLPIAQERFEERLEGVSHKIETANSWAQDKLARFPNLASISIDLGWNFGLEFNLTLTWNRSSRLAPDTDPTTSSPSPPHLQGTDYIKPPKESRTMDREQLRKLAIANAETIMNTHILWNHLSEEQQRMTRAAYTINQKDDPVVNAYFDALAAAYNNQV